MKPVLNVSEADVTARASTQGVRGDAPSGGVDSPCAAESPCRPLSAGGCTCTPRAGGSAVAGVSCIYLRAPTGIGLTWNSVSKHSRFWLSGSTSMHARTPRIAW